MVWKYCSCSSSLKVTATLCNDCTEAKTTGLLFMHTKQQISVKNLMFDLQRAGLLQQLGNLQITTDSHIIISE